ncbi:hypothetical protein EGM88_05995 [Aureibaculum marinum]|uniref:Uncharacterized protein n=2 Tax=Aureibaculum marinum TaxID=2487930 RepID=A0A3N4P4R9_9FLAO|nr:hypothetical protein EGM88_05995 [Aureibaculum marinum]
MLLSRKEIVELTKVSYSNCISIFIPTHRAGKKVLQDEDKLYLKMQLKIIKNKLSHNGMHISTINKMLAPVQELIDNGSFWREQSDGLAIFVADGFFKKYCLPIHFKEFNYVSNSFYIKPLTPILVGDGEFYLLLLEFDNVKLYECTHHSFTEIIIDDLIPNKQERHGYNYQEKELQFRTQQGGSNQVMYHGQETTSGKKKNETNKYLKAINDGLKPLLNKKNIPLLIASQDYLFDIYKDINTYNTLHHQNIKINLNNSDIYETHELAWKEMASIFDQPRKDKIAEFLEAQGSGKTAIGITEILNAAFLGKIDTLFCLNDSDITGNYKEKNNTLIVTETQENNTTISLMNLAVTKTFLNDGTVYLLEKDEMPNANSKINALFRY